MLGPARVLRRWGEGARRADGTRRVPVALAHGSSSLAVSTWATRGSPSATHAPTRGAATAPSRRPRVDGHPSVYPGGGRPPPDGPRSPDPDAGHSVWSVAVRLATWNVNSIRTRADRVVAWLQRSDVDVLA